MKIESTDRKAAKELLKQLTLEEKITMIHGAGLFQTGEVKRLHIPAFRSSDGPMGVRREFQPDSWTEIGNTDDYVTYLPSNSAIAATWNRQLAFDCGSVLGEEARGRGKDMILAPGINVKRSPLCGRNFEYMSEDPYLTAEQCVPLIQGIQEHDVAACVKHFALNNQERNRLWVNVEVEERALREIYLPAFEAAVQKGGVLAVMGAYNLVRGIRCCENNYLLKQILREEWGFEGITVSDWGGILRTKESAEADMDMEMSIHTNFDDYCFAKPLKCAVENGEIEEKEIDRKVYHILCVMSALHMLPQPDKGKPDKRKPGGYHMLSHRQKALETARESIILLKNENHRLPLDAKRLRKLLVVGANADRLHSCGGGSAEVKALYEISPLMGLKAYLGGNTEVAYVQGYYVPEDDRQDGAWQEDSLKDREGRTKEKEQVSETVLDTRRKLLQEAAELAQSYEEVVFIGGLDHQLDLEDCDRPDMKLPYGQDEVIEELLKVNPNTVIVMNAGSPVEMGRWMDQARAILWHWYAGMEGGSALAEVIFGEVNPSGKLPETIPYTHTDCSAHCVGEFGKKDEVVYKEGIYVGYRYYEKEQVPVAYPFGHGLSYTEFTYSDLRVVLKEAAAAAPWAEVSCRIQNTGTMAGKEAVQLYVHALDSRIERPWKELKGYQKIALLPGESRDVHFTLHADAFHYYDVQQGRFLTEAGRYEILCGASSKDIRLRQEIRLSEALERTEQNIVPK